MSDHPHHWQDVLWHEGRRCSDVEYGTKLNEVVQRQPIGCGNALLETLIGGAQFSLWLSCLLYFVAATELNIGGEGILDGLVAIWTGPWGLACLGAGFFLAVILNGPLMLRHRMTRESSEFKLAANLGCLPFAGFFVGLVIFFIARFVQVQREVPETEYPQFLEMIVIGYLVCAGLSVLSELGLTYGEEATFPLEQGPRQWWTPRLWLRPAPRAAEVEWALRRLVETRIKGWEEWAKVLERLEARRTDDELLTSLGEYNWAERLVARQHLVARGGRVCDRLAEVSSRNDDETRLGAKWVLERISRESARDVRPHMSVLMCREHLARPSKHLAQAKRKTPENKWKDVTIAWYGCRACGDSRDLRVWAGEVVAVLDSGMMDDDVEQGWQLRINWLARRSLFDFDRVEIVNATDEDVERFVIQVDNDTDPVRCARYRKMRCVIAPDCGLSEISRRILRDTFKRVVQKKRSRKGAS